MGWYEYETFLHEVWVTSQVEYPALSDDNAHSASVVAAFAAIPSVSGVLILQSSARN